MTDPATTVSAFLLDLDGTLVDSEPIHRRGYRGTPPNPGGQS